MKAQKNSDRKRKTAAVLAIVLVIALLLSVVAPILSIMAYGAEVERAVSPVVSPSNEVVDLDEEEETEPEVSYDTTKNENISFESSIGFDNSYILGYTVPFDFIIGNKGADFSGEVQLTVYSREYTNNDNTQAGGEYALYCHRLDLPQNSTKKVSLEMPVSTARGKFKVALVNNAGVEIYSTVATSKALDPETVLVGVLSDAPEYLSYLKSMTLVESRYSGVNLNKQILFNAETLPDSADILKSIKVLIIDYFDTASLSEEQLNAIYEWNQAGGLLVLGTGEGAELVLNGLGEKIGAYVENPNPNFIYDFPDIMSGHGLSTEGWNSRNPLTTKDIIMDDSFVVLGDDTNPLSIAKKNDNGYIILHNFSLSSNVANSMKDMSSLLEGVYKSYGNSFIVYNNDSYYYLGDTNRLPVRDSKKVFLSYSIIAAYCIIIGPILYFILKAKDRREKGWVVVPALSIIAFLGIYAISLSSPYRDSAINVISYSFLGDNESDKAESIIQMGIKSPKNGDINFKMDEKADIQFSDSYYGGGYYYGGDSVKNILTKKVYMDGQTDVTFYDIPSWQTNEISYQKTIDVGGPLKVDLKIDGGKYSGTITNDTEYDFSDAVLRVFDFSFIRVGDILSGETINIDIDTKTLIEDKASLYYGDYYYAVAKAYGIEDPYQDLQVMAKQAGLTKNEIREVRKKIQSINRMINGGYRPNASSKGGRLLTNFATLYAFTNEVAVKGDKLINDKPAMEFNQNMFIRDIDIAIGGNIDIPVGLLTPNAVYAEGYDIYSNTVYIYQGDKVNFDFKVTDGVEIESFTISWDDLSYSPVVSKSIFNNDTGEWEELSDQPYENVSPYINGNGFVTIMGDLQDTGEVPLPTIGMKGGAN